jgi:hypothetical protein
MLLLAFIMPLPLFAVWLSVAMQTGCASVRAAANSVGSAICSIYNRLILSDVLSVFHELTLPRFHGKGGFTHNSSIDHTRPV